MSIFRFFKIFYVVFKFGLDEFLLAHSKLKFLRFIFSALFFWRNIERPRGERLRLALEALGPIFVKFGQMLSTRRDLIPLDIVNELAKLQDKVPPFDFELVQKSIEAAFEQPLSAIYSEFDEQAIASASVAQVHFARLPNGQDVAVKVLRPGIAKVIKGDLKLLNTIAWLVNTLSAEGRRLKPQEVVEEFARHTIHELDLTLEAANCSQLARNFPADKTGRKKLLIPEVYWDWCRREVMTMQRMAGTPISQIDVIRSHGIDISKLAREGVEIFFTQVFRDGFFHADMHPGNIQVADDGRYIALDFGIMGSLSEGDKYYLARNFLAFFNRDYRDVAMAHIESGWVPKNTSVDELETAIRAICEPIFDKPLKDISFGRTLLSLFQMSRRFGVVIQPQLILLQKTMLNIEGLGRDLDPDLDLWKTAQPFLTRWMSEQVGWRSVVKNIKHELPYWAATLPKIPHLIHQSLEQNQLPALTVTLEKLVNEQKRQRKWFAAITLILLMLVVLEGYAYFEAYH